MRKSLFVFATLMLIIPAILAAACAKPAPPASSPQPTAPAAAPKTTAPAPAAKTTAPATSPAAAKPAQTVRLQIGATSSTSALFAWNVGLSQVINKNVPGYNITVMEAAASYANLKEMVKGTYDFVMATFDSANELYNGLETFKGAAWKDVRIMWLRELTWMQLWVRKDSGVKTFTDLAGKKFTPGVAGSAAALVLNRGIDVTGIKIDLWYADYADAVTALADGRIVGVGKTSPPFGMDASLLEAHLKRPLTIVGFTEAQAKAIMAKYPNASMVYYPVGTNKELPEAGDFWGSPSLSGSIGSSKMSEEVVYRMTKAIHENYKEVAAAYAPAGKFDPVKDSLSSISPNVTVPLHAGVVKYAKEKGWNVPANLIPPEYSGK